VLLSGIDVEVDVESHGQRRRCRRGVLRGHAGLHGMRGGFYGPWGMRGGVPGKPGCHGMRGGVAGRPGCHPRGRWCGPRWCGPGAPPPAWFHEQPAAAAAAAAAAAGTAQQPSAGAPQPADNSTQNVPCRDPDTNAETGEMASCQHEATAVLTDQDWTLVNDGVTDVESATTGVEQLHMSAPPAEVPDTAVPGT